MFKKTSPNSKPNLKPIVLFLDPCIKLNAIMDYTNKLFVVKRYAIKLIVYTLLCLLVVIIIVVLFKIM